MDPLWYTIGLAAGQALRDGWPGLLGYAIGSLLGLAVLWLLMALDERYDILWRLFRL